MNTRSETFDERLARLRVRTSVDGWKGSRSVRVEPTTWDRALTLIRTTDEAVGRQLHPFVSCGGDGTVWLQWGELPHAVFDVEVVPDTGIAWELDTPDDFQCGAGEDTSCIQIFFDFYSGHLSRNSAC